MTTKGTDHMSESKKYDLEGMPGDHISRVAQRAVELVAGGRPSVCFEFNGIEVTVTPGMSAGDAVATYHRLSDEQRRTYEESPEYKESMRKAREEVERKKLERDGILAFAPAAMTLRDPAGWEKAKAANTDGYGGAVMTYAERWARIMEAMMAGGKTLPECAERASSLADVEGITGFMYGCAVSTLAHVWQHGEELRRWHNKTSQIRDEGDRANETGGVLNPAMLTIG